MSQFIGFAIPGVPYGCTFAIVAVGLVLTYQATGVFNFAFGAQAYMSAYAFTRLVQSAGLPVWLAFILSVVILAPAFGLVLDRLLFRKIPNSNTTAKLIMGISIFVGVPELIPVLFGSQNIYNAPSILFNPNVIYFHVFTAPFSGTDLSSVVCAAAVLIALVILMRFTNLGLQMRGAVESRRLVQLDGVNSGKVVATAWAISSFMAGLAGVILAPLNNQLQFDPYYATLMVAAFACAAWASLRSLPIAAAVGVLLGVLTLVLQGYLPASSSFSAALLYSMPFIALFAALLIVPGLRRLDESADPLASVDPPVPPTAASARAPQMDRIIRRLWYLFLGAFIVSMLTWIPATWTFVFNEGLAFAVIFLSITLITGMGGQLSLAQATLAGVGAFTAAQLANHLGLNILVGGIVGAVLAAVVATILALASLRLKGLGLALMTIAAALFFDNAIFDQSWISNGVSLTIQQKWVGLGLFNPNGHNVFILEMIVLVICVVVILLIRKGTIGQYLSAMRGSETAAAGLGINLTWQRILVFAISGAMAGIGGTLLVVQQQTINNTTFSYFFSLVFVVIVVSTGVNTVEGAINGAFAFVIIQQLLTYVPARLGGNSLVLVLFAFGALQYANHPEGVLEFQKRRSTLRFEGLLFKPKEEEISVSGGLISGAGGTNGSSAVGGPAVETVEALGADPRGPV